MYNLSSYRFHAYTIRTSLLHSEDVVVPIQDTVSNESPSKDTASQVDISSDFDIADDWVNNFNDKVAEAMDASLANYEAKIMKTPVVKEDNPTLNPPLQPSAKPADVQCQSQVSVNTASQATSPPTPSPHPIIVETTGYPSGSPFQPVRFSDDTIAFVPIVKDEKGVPNNKIFDHICRLAKTCSVNVSDYELTRVEQFSSRPHIAVSLSLSKSVVIKHLKEPRDEFNLRFVTSTYKIPDDTSVDMHGKATLCCS